MKYLIVDDEPLALMRMQKMLENQGITNIITASNGQIALEQVKKHHPHVIFLDIEMPVLRGIDAAPLIHEISPESKIIFCTAYDEYAIKAFDLSVSDYLLKPVKKQRLIKALEKVSIYTNNNTITVHQGTNTVRLGIEDIYCIVSEDKATILHCQLGEIIIDESLVTLENKFSQQLLRINRNALINVSELFGIHRDKSQAFVKLKSTDVQPQISRRNISKIKELLL
ncbi:MAG: LytR/AlgR family response regulator transcription factor [Marinicellaceae bacterium]